MIVPYQYKKFPTLEEARIGVFGYNDYDEHIKNSVWRYTKREPGIKIQDTDVVLDIGSGIGDTSKALAKIAKKVYCYDINLDYLAFAKDNCKGIDNMEFHHVDNLISPLCSLSDNSISKSYAQLVFIHNCTEMIITYLKDLSRVLAPGGMFTSRFITEVGEGNSDIIESDSDAIRSAMLELDYNIIEYKEETWSNKGVDFIISRPA